MPEAGEASFPQELETRLNELRNILSNKELANIQPDLSKYWMTELLDGIPEAMERYRRWGSSTAMVIQFADGALHGSDRHFIRKYFTAFGAYVTNNQGERTYIDGDNIGDVISHNLPIFLYEPGKDIKPNISSGTALLEDKDGRDKYLIMETKIDGVKLMVDGTVVSSPKSGFKIVRPMLLIDMGDISKLPPLPPEKEDPRKTWTQVHKREPGLRKIRGENGDDQIMVGNDYLGYSEVIKENKDKSFYIPLSGDEIKVTPTQLKENPALNTKEVRIKAIKEAFSVVLNHLYDPAFFEEKPVVGGSVFAIRKMVEVLGMTPSEIMKDGEAMADMCEYLKQIAQSNGKVFGPSKIMPNNTTEGDPIMELVYLIEDTWELPEIAGFHFLTESRVRARK